MKTIPNRSFKIKLREDDAEFLTTAALIDITLVQAPDPSPENPRGGFDFVTMRERKRVSDVLEKLAKDAVEIVFEDADYAVVRKCAKAYRWGVNHPALLDFASLLEL